MEICKFCNNKMLGEFETLKNGEYNFFYVCHNCSSIYEGRVKETNKEKKIIYSRWYNPKTNNFEEII